MAEETTPNTEDPASTADAVPPAVAAEAPQSAEPPAPEAAAPAEQAVAIEQASAPETPEEADAIQPYIDKVKENIKLALEEPDIGAFLRAHIKTLREDWDGWSESAKYAYTHMMTAQLLSLIHISEPTRH